MSDTQADPQHEDVTTRAGLSLQVIGVVHSCYRQKFGIPRQPRLTTADESEIELLPPFNQPSMIRGLEEVSHIWVQFIFHENLAAGWRPTVRPPKLGGRKRIGVFATRSTHRPNPIGLSAVRLKGVHVEAGRVTLKLGSSDLLDQTPVIDIKPYLPYSDHIEEASNTLIPAPALTPVRFSERASRECLEYEAKTQRALRTLIAEVITQDPRPSYLAESTHRRHGFLLWDLNVVWESRGDHFLVTHLEPAPHAIPDATPHTQPHPCSTSTS